MPKSSRVRWSLFGGAALLLCALWLLPLSVLIWPIGSARGGVAARTVDGTVWNGRLLDASVQGALAGDVSLRLMPADILTGQFRFRLGSLSAQPVSGDAFAGLSGRGVRNLDARVIPGSGLHDLGLTAAQTTGLNLLFQNGACKDASGQLTVYLGGGALSRVAGPQLSGPATCANGQLSFRLTDPEAKAALTIEYPEGKTPSYTLIFRPSVSLDKGALQAMGFRETPVGFRRAGVLPR